MKKFTLLLVLAVSTLTASAQQYGKLWVFSNALPPGKPVLQPDKFKYVAAEEQNLSAYLTTITKDASKPSLIDLPTPDGTLRSFYIWATDLMDPLLSDKYPDIHTFTASAVDNHLVTAKIDYTPFGLHAMVADGSQSFFVDPYNKVANGGYISYYRRDYRGTVGSKAVCAVDNEPIGPSGGSSGSGGHTPNSVAFRMNGSVRRTYRLALACTGEYAVAVAGPSPTKGAVLAQMVTTLNRVNSVYERDLAITMQLVANNDTLIFLDGNTDPFSDGNAFAMLTQNQTITDNRIGTANYDIGHIFGIDRGGTGAGLGIAKHGICQQLEKAQGVTGRPNPTGDAFDIDFVSHEMGHQFGAEHSFNSNGSGACSGNAYSLSAYEPGSGSTIMAYAGICGNEDLQPNTDPYFHSASLEQITTYVTQNTCASLSPSNNTNASLPSYTASYSIPYLTAFELTAPLATDTTADTVTYCWEQRDLGDFGRSIAQTRLRGPLFRSFMPKASPTRVFPNLDSVLKSVFSSKLEKVPDTARTLCFRLTQRDIFQGFGCFNFPDDSIHLNVVNTRSPFRVMAPNSSVNWLGGTTQNVLWNVSSTDLPPINCSNVDIYLSTDGGHTFPTLLVGNTPNDGSESVVLPSGNMSDMRIKVKGVGNVFFAISHTTPTTTIPRPTPTPGVVISPVPADKLIEVRFIKNGEIAFARIMNTLGQLVWSGTINTQQALDVSSWSRGIYYLTLQNDTSINVTRTILVQ